MDKLLIVGLGDIAKRALPRLQARYDVVALVRTGITGAAGADRALAGLGTIRGDLDHPESLAAIAGTADCVLHTAPPPAQGADDPRTKHLLAVLETAALVPRTIVYISTSGVYGDCRGEFVDESRAVSPTTDRARRRVDAETQLFAFARRHGSRVVVLRAPGIYAADRLPLRRLRNRTPVLREADDVYTNHVHAEDLAAMCCQALEDGHAAGIYNACDDAAMPMGAWFDLLADRSGLPRPPRIPRTDAAERIPGPLLSFMSESRRLRNEKIKRELGFVLRYPTVHHGVPQQIDVSDD